MTETNGNSTVYKPIRIDALVAAINEIRGSIENVPWILVSPSGTMHKGSIEEIM